MNSAIAAAMAVCLQHMSGGTWEHDFQACDRISIEYNQEVESLTASPAAMPGFSESRSRQQDIDAVNGAAAALLK